MSGYYYFNCNGPVQVGPWANYNEALLDCVDTYGGPCEFLGCSQPPCGAPPGINIASDWKPSEEFIAIAAQRKIECEKRNPSAAEVSLDRVLGETPLSDENEAHEPLTIRAEIAREAVPCHKCGCRRFIDFDPQDGLCDNLNGSNPAEYCKHPLVSHY